MPSLVMALASGLAAHPSFLSPGHAAVYVPAAVGLLCAGAAATGRSAWSYAAVTFLTLSYTASLLLGDVLLDVWAPLYGVGVYLFIETAATVARAREGSTIEGEVTAARAIFVLGAGAGGGAAALTAFWLGGASPTSGPVAFAAAIVAALVVLAVMVVAARRTLDPVGPPGGG